MPPIDSYLSSVIEMSERLIDKFGKMKLQWRAFRSLALEKFNAVQSSKEGNYPPIGTEDLSKSELWGTDSDLLRSSIISGTYESLFVNYYVISLI